jgi:hypothetical protein
MCPGVATRRQRCERDQEAQNRPRSHGGHGGTMIAASVMKRTTPIASADASRLRPAMNRGMQSWLLASACARNTRPEIRAPIAITTSATTPVSIPHQGASIAQSKRSELPRPCCCRTLARAAPIAPAHGVKGEPASARPSLSPGCRTSRVALPRSNVASNRRRDKAPPSSRR